MILDCCFRNTLILLSLCTQVYSVGKPHYSLSPCVTLELCELCKFNCETVLFGKLITKPLHLEIHIDAKIDGI